MNCVVGNCVYALLGVVLSATTAFGKGKDNISLSETAKDKFQWNEHSRLSWDDFKGVVNTTHDESAAATYCSIGFTTGTSATTGKTEIVVYNTFYINKSWVRADARIQSILDHEQGHFDLCEIYTRQLKQRLSNIDLDVPGIKAALMQIYTEVSQQYESRQQAYEAETLHGTNTDEQRKWQQAIACELQPATGTARLW